MSYLDAFSKIKAFAFDVDGVLTNGQVVLLPDGQQMRHMHSKDGYALQMAVKKGYAMAIITGGNSIQVKERLMALGITDIYLNSTHKIEALDDFKFSYGLQYDEILYMGDDIPDISVLNLVGLPCCPADASIEVKSIAKYIAKAKGGEGCVREIIEKVMRSHGNWFDDRIHMENLAEFTW